MGVLSRNKNQLTYIYSEKSNWSLKMLAILQTSNKKLLALNIDKEDLGDTIWVEVAALLKKPIDALFRMEDLQTEGLTTNVSYDTHDWIKIINKKPELLHNPIIVSDTDIKQVLDREDLFCFLESAGADFNKDPEAIKKGNHNGSSSE